MSHHDHRDDGFDDFLDAVADGDPEYVKCDAGHGSLPPRQVCPRCGSETLERAALPERGTVVSHTTIYVAGSAFAEDAPYTVAVADFGPVKVTGFADGPDALGFGDEVGLEVSHSETSGERLLALCPVGSE